MVKTGSIYFRDETGALWLAESFVGESGLVSTQQTLLEAPQPPAEERTQLPPQYLNQGGFTAVEG